MFESEQQRRLEEEKHMLDRMARQDESMKRRQEENNMFMQVRGAAKLPNCAGALPNCARPALYARDATD